MSTYSPKKLLSLWRLKKIDVEMATGHTLQNLVEQQETQAATNVTMYQLRSKVDTLESTVNTLQAEIARLTAAVEKFLPKRK